jgi:SAM-dependent methyltransferase
MTTSPAGAGVLDEPLLESAKIARQLARSLCRRNPATGVHCGPSHGLWQYLRLLGLALSPVYHQDFFRRGLDRMAGAGGPVRILVSGAADYAMLAQVVAAFQGRTQALAATVLDLCETPLALNRWYAERVGQQIETCCSDILDYSADLPFDGISTHSFLAMLPVERRPALLSKWRELLRPGGIAVTVNRVRPAHEESHVVFSAEEVRAYAETVRAKGVAFGPKLGIDPGELARDAETYALEQRFYPVRSAEELRALFEDAGFRVDTLECGPLMQRAQDSTERPTVPGTADYLRIIATRR